MDISDKLYFPMPQLNSVIVVKFFKLTSVCAVIYNEIWFGYEEKMMCIIVKCYNRPNSQIPQYTCPITHNAPLRTEMFTLCIVGHVSGALWDLWDWFICITVKSLIYDAPNPKIEMILISSWSRLCPTLWSQGLSREWRCSWSSADRRCSNYIWVIHSLIAY